MRPLGRYLGVVMLFMAIGLTTNVSAQQTDVVKVGVNNVISDIVFYFAQDRGFFSEQKLKVEMIPFDSGPRMIAPLGVGQTDVGAGASSAGLYKAVARGIDVKIVVIVGPSGCGKTTLLRILAGLDAQSEGRFEVRQSNPARPANSMVFQGDSLFPWMTAFDKCRLWAAHAQDPRERSRGHRPSLARADRAVAVPRPVPKSTVRRDEATGGDRARLCQRSRDPADGRAVLGAERAEQAFAARGIASGLGCLKENRGVHYS